MKASKAVETIDDILADEHSFYSEAQREAIALGKEALKRLLHFRTRSYVTVRSLLPNEEPEEAKG